jgi:hypothetical protein
VSEQRSGSLVVEAVCAVQALVDAGVSLDGHDDHGPYRRSWGECIAALAAERDEAVRQRDELRAVLEPLLEQERDRTRGPCAFCRRMHCGDTDDHAPNCPVLPAVGDTLLGRDRAPAPPEGP